MHLYNAWLPPPVAEESKKEADSFSRVVSSVKNSYRSDDPDSVYSTLKWVSVIDLFIKAKSEVSMEDVSGLIEFGLELFRVSENKLYAQVRWGNILVKLLNKYRKKLSLKVKWRPLYDTLIHTHFSRNTGPEGWRLRQRHFEATTSLVRSCRKFFPQGSAVEIWSEFRKGNKDLLEEQYLGRSERQFFVKVVLKLIDRGQYSKNDHLSETVAAATSILSYVEPSLILPFVASRFHMALETVNEIAWNITGDKLFVTTGKGDKGDEKGIVQVLSYPSLQALDNLLAHTAGCNCIAVDPCGRYIAVGSADSLVSLWDVSEMLCMQTFANIESAVRTVSFNQSGEFLASGSTDRSIDITDVRTGRTVHQIPCGPAVNSVDWNPRSNLLAYAGRDNIKGGNVRIFGFTSAA